METERMYWRRGHVLHARAILVSFVYYETALSSLGLQNHLGGRRAAQLAVNAPFKLLS
jgi:hypothetical protein